MSGPQATSESAQSTTPAIPALVSKPDLVKLFAYWCSKRQGRPMPAKQDIDPLEIGWALSRIFLMDYSPEQGFVYRLAGADISGVFGRANLKGLNLREVVKPERRDAIEEAWLKIIAEPSILVMKGMVYLGADRTPIGERLLLPLADEADGPVTGLLGMTVCEWIIGEVPAELKLARVETLPVSEIP